MDIDECSNDSEEYVYNYSDDEDDFDDENAMMDGNPAEGGGDEDARSEMETEGKAFAVDPDNRPPKSDRCDRKADNNPNAAPVSSMEFEDGISFGSSRSIRMLKAKELMPIMKQRLREVTEVLDIPSSAAAVLMREHGWSKERLFEAYCTDPENLQQTCGVRARCHRATKPPTKLSARRRDCAICCDDDFSPDQMLGMPCGHEFCRNCWRGFIKTTLSDGPVCVRARCPEAGCSELVTEEEVREAATDLLPTFQSYQLRSFVEVNALTRWCPGPGCERIAVAPAGAGGLFGDAAGVAHCDDCGTSFCLKCAEEPHSPMACKDLAKWNQKCKNESETANWILANTKPCPKCSSRIEKNQGCNHMTCQQCKYEFCWICMGNWTDHGANTGGYYKCNKFDPNDDTNGDLSDKARAKRELDRYLHYYKRFHAHAEAQKFAKRQLRETEARMVLLQESSDNSTWTDVEFLKIANEQLVECRRVLKYTYSFAYYISEDKSRTMQKERFEHHQEMLERFTENLSELSEKPLADMDRTDVVNQTRVVDRFMKNILKYVEDGLEEA